MEWATAAKRAVSAFTLLLSKGTAADDTVSDANIYDIKLKGNSSWVTLRPELSQLEPLPPAVHYASPRVDLLQQAMHSPGLKGMSNS